MFGVKPNQQVKNTFVNICFVYLSRAKYNLPKNRYSDVLCLDHSRFVLPSFDNDPSCDYINANYVDGYMQKHAYISTQGTLGRQLIISVSALLLSQF